VGKYLLLAVIALTLLAGCSKTHKGDEIGKPPGTSTNGQTQDGDGSSTDKVESGSVLTGALAGLKSIYFDFDKYNLRDDAKRTLETNAKLLMENSRTRIAIEGHCDERGTNEYNLALGEKRASAARDYLIRLGVDAAQISVISYGEERPVSMGHDEESWAKNRRGEFAPK
jgi:peptidoglycan-associated lipoprotein